MNDQIKNFRIDVAAAEALIADAMPDFGTQRVPLHEAANQVLAQPIVAERDQPPFNRATMDGIAVALKEQRSFAVSGIQAAGQDQSSLPDEASCIETMTGAVMPAGSDTMIPVERIAIDNGIATLEDGYNPEPGQFIHPRASDHSAGDLLLEPGVMINAAEMAILTAAGQPEVEITKWPEIAIVSTGDELVDVGAPMTDAQIRSSNDRAIETAFHNRGCTTTRRHHLPDDPQELLRQVRMLHDECGVLILSGGVSMGKYDYVPAILNELNITVVFHKILQRPGLPMWFGVSTDNKPVFALPGNPVSTLVCLTRYVLPALFKAMGRLPKPEYVRLQSAVEFKPDLCWFLPVAVHSDSEGNMLAEPRPTNTSGDFIGLRGTDGFIELPRGNDNFAAGYAARLYRW
ncbi:MAG: molybdopterin molybdotransferase MoeA [Gammaproteobacteria bacterium]